MYWWAFAPPGPLLAPPLRKNCPTSNWAHLKKFNFMSIYQEHRRLLDTPSKNHCFTRTQSLVTTIGLPKHYWKEGTDALVAAEAMLTLYSFIMAKWRHLCLTQKQPSEYKKVAMKNELKKKRCHKVSAKGQSSTTCFFHCHLQLKDKVSKNQYSQHWI